jgi:hypothetical protein
MKPASSNSVINSLSIRLIYDPYKLSHHANTNYKMTAVNFKTYNLYIRTKKQVLWPQWGLLFQNCMSKSVYERSFSI